MIKFNRFAFCCLIIIFTCFFYWVGTAGAAPVTKRQNNLKPAAQFKGAIRVEQGKAMELTTRKKVVYLAVGKEKIADAVPVDPKRIRILGLKEGATNLVIVYNDDSADEYEILVNKGFRVEVLNGVITNPDTSLTGW